MRRRTTVLGGSSQDEAKWLITMVIVNPLRIGLFPFQMAFPWLINGGYYLLTNWDDPPSRGLEMRIPDVFGWFLQGNLYMSHEKRAPGWLGYIGDDKLASHIGIIISHYKDPY